MAIEFRDVERELMREAMNSLREGTIQADLQPQSITVRELQNARNMLGSPNQFVQYGDSFGTPYGPMVRRRLKLEFEGKEIILQTDVPRGMPAEYWSRQFADQVRVLLRDFPRNWSTASNPMPEEGRENSESEDVGPGSRFGAAFE